VAGDNQRNGVRRHRLPDGTGMFGTGVQRLRDGAIGGRFTPAERADERINLCEKGGLPAGIDRYLEKLDPLAVEIADSGVDDRRYSDRRLRAYSAG